jgi:hypothetical protein
MIYNIKICTNIELENLIKIKIETKFLSEVSFERKLNLLFLLFYSFFLSFAASAWHFILPPFFKVILFVTMMMFFFSFRVKLF